MPDVDRELLAMRQAVLLGARGLGTTSPNPPVGCVVLGPGGEVVGTGFHERKGSPHAEGMALSSAGERARGGTAVVTLEPCNHAGRTPACRQLLLDAGIARVVIGVLDPTSRGEGGAAVLRAAGVDVQVGLLADEARLVLAPWLRALELRRPLVTWLTELRDEGFLPAPADLLEDVRRGHDAVLLPGGRVVEGIPDGHGHGAFQLPECVARLDAAALLDAAYAGGTRTLLLAGGHGEAREFLDAAVVDRLLVLDNRHACTHTPQELRGYELERVRRWSKGLLAEFAH